MNYFDELVALIPPPADVKTHTEAKWADLEAKVGTPLPADYKLLIDRYGEGYFCSLLIVASPFGMPNYFAFHQEHLRDTYERFGNHPFTGPFDLTIFPETGGLLYFTTDDVNGFLCWKTEGAPEDWTLLMANDRLWTREEFPMSFTEFILRFARNEIKSERFSDEPPMEPTFTPRTR